MVEIGVEDLMGLLDFEKPVVRGPVKNLYPLFDITDEVFTVGSFTKTTTFVRDRYVTPAGQNLEFDVEEIFAPPGMNRERPVVRGPVSAGSTVEIYIGGKNPEGGDTLRLIEIVANPIVSDFSADVTYGKVPLVVSFTDESLNNPTSWLWNFGDGTTSGMQNPVHVYFNTGQYSVSLTAINDESIDFTLKTDYIFAYRRIDFFIISY
jgi:PKD repeat protein